jgi:spermidine/putrescine transport system ATP-binding protein
VTTAIPAAAVAAPVTLDGRGVAVRLTGTTKRYGALTAVDALNLEVPRGEFLALLGPSGCGKTTTLRMIGGFETPDTGSIEIDGVDVTRKPPDRRPVNTVFQSYALFPHMSVFDNVEYGLRVRGMSRGESKQAVEAALKLVGLADVGGKRPRQLSGGMQQRVALARALVLKPTVLLLDEPLGSLDLKFRKQMQVELRRLHREVGGTFIHVTHDQEEAMTMADRICIMDRGQIVQMGTPTEIYDHPNSRYVAGFIGSMSFLEGTISAVEGDAATVAVPGAGDLRARLGQRLSVGDKASFSVRPEQLQPLDGPGQAGSSVRGRLVDLVPTGASSLARVAVGDGELVAQVARSFSAAMGDELTLGWDPSAAAAFAGPSK